MISRLLCRLSFHRWRYRYAVLSHGIGLAYTRRCADCERLDYDITTDPFGPCIWIPYRIIDENPRMQELDRRIRAIQNLEEETT